MNPEPLPVTLTTPELSLGERERRHLNHAVARLDAWTKRIPRRALQVTIRHQAREGINDVQLVMEVPGKTLIAHDQAPFLTAALDRAFKKLGRQVRDHKSVIRRDHLHQRVRESRSTSPEIPESEVGEAARQRDLEEFRARAAGHVTRLQRFLSEESSLLSRKSRALESTVDDMVEDTIAEALERFGEKPWALPSSSWLYSVALEVLERNLQRGPVTSIAIMPDASVLDGRLPEDDLYDGLQRMLFPSEEERDGSPQHFTAEPRVLNGAAEDPAEAAEEADLRVRVSELLSELPGSWRRAFLLHFLEGFDLLEIAQIQGLTEDQVRFSVQSAELFLRERLNETPARSRAPETRSAH